MPKSSHPIYLSPVYERENLSNVIAGSIKDIEDVIAAKNSKIKKEEEISDPKSIDPNAMGKVEKLNLAQPYWDLNYM